VSFDRHSLRVSFHHERQVWERREPPARSWDFGADIAPFHRQTAGDRVTVGSGVALVVELDRRDPLDALDEHSETALHIGKAIFDPATGGLAEDFAGKLEQLGDRLVGLSAIGVEERWRGRGLGPVIAGLVVEALGGGALAVVCKPAPLHRPRGTDGGTRDDGGHGNRAVAKLSQLCTTPGFRPHRDGVLFLDPCTTDFDRKFAAVMDRFLEGPEELVPTPDNAGAARLRLVSLQDGTG
jgi:hypothetical protein